LDRFPLPLERATANDELGFGNAQDFCLYYPRNYQFLDLGELVVVAMEIRLWK